EARVGIALAGELRGVARNGVERVAQLLRVPDPGLLVLARGRQRDGLAREHDGLKARPDREGDRQDQQRHERAGGTAVAMTALAVAALAVLLGRLRGIRRRVHFADPLRAGSAATDGACGSVPGFTVTVMPCAASR